MLPLVCLIVIVQMLVAAYARSYREAQTYLGLLQLLPVIPYHHDQRIAVYTQAIDVCPVPLIGQQLALARLLRAESLPALPLALCSLATLLIAAAAFVATTRLLRLGAPGARNLSGGPGPVGADPWHDSAHDPTGAAPVHRATSAALRAHRRRLQHSLGYPGLS